MIFSACVNDVVVVHFYTSLRCLAYSLQRVQKSVVFGYKYYIVQYLLAKLLE